MSQSLSNRDMPAENTAENQLLLRSAWKDWDIVSQSVLNWDRRTSPQGASVTGLDLLGHCRSGRVPTSTHDMNGGPQKERIRRPASLRSVHDHRNAYSRSRNRCSQSIGTSVHFHRNTHMTRPETNLPLSELVSATIQECAWSSPICPRFCAAVTTPSLRSMSRPKSLLAARGSAEEPAR